MLLKTRLFSRSCLLTTNAQRSKRRKSCASTSCCSDTICCSQALRQIPTNLAKQYIAGVGFPDSMQAFCMLNQDCESAFFATTALHDMVNALPGVLLVW